MHRSGEVSTATMNQISFTHHSGTGEESNRQQTATQPDRIIGPDGTADLNREQLRTIGT